MELIQGIHKPKMTPKAMCSSNKNAYAFGGSNQISPWTLTIRTGGRAAEIHLLLTVEAREARRAMAAVPSVRVVRTPPPVEAGAICTSHGTQLTDLAVEAGRAGARVAVL